MITLTQEEIRELAMFAGLNIDSESDERERKVGYVISACPPEGVRNDGEPGEPDSVSHYGYIVYCAEYPEEGCMGLGPEIERAEQGGQEQQP